jgi:flagellar biosynthesis/type III secretory pathway protein FliH
MKNFKTIVFTVIALVFSLNVATAQSKKKAEKQKENAIKVDEKRDQKLEMMERKLENATPEEQKMIREKMEAYKAEKGNNGNAYGKNKGELEGKEFGQARAAEAKEKVQTIYYEIQEENSRIKNSAIRIKQAEERLELAVRNGELSESAAAAKRTKIEKEST